MKKAIILVLFLTVWVQAVPVTIEITGHITSVIGSGFPSAIQVGSTFTGDYTYETSTPVSGEGHYIHSSPYGLSLLLSGYSFETMLNHDEQFVVSVLDEYTPPNGNTHDDYWVYSYANSPLSDGTVIDTIRWFLLDGSRTALSSNELPTSAPVLDDWGTNQLRIYGPDDAFVITGTVTQAVLVPEPLTSLLMLASGIFFIKRK